MNKGGDVRRKDDTFCTDCPSNIGERDWGKKGAQNVQTRKLHTMIFSKILLNVLPKGFRSPENL